jgi:hypothetical protein
VIVISGVVNNPGLAVGVDAVTTFDSIGRTSPLAVIVPGSLAAATLNCVVDGTAVTTTLVLFQPDGALSAVVTWSPTFKLCGTTVVKVSAPLANVAAVMSSDRPLMVASASTVRPRSRNPIVVAGPGSARPLITSVELFGTDEIATLLRL